VVDWCRNGPTWTELPSWCHLDQSTSCSHEKNITWHHPERLSNTLQQFTVNLLIFFRHKYTKYRAVNRNVNFWEYYWSIRKLQFPGLAEYSNWTMHLPTLTHDADCRDESDDGRHWGCCTITPVAHGCLRACMHLNQHAVQRDVCYMWQTHEGDHLLQGWKDGWGPVNAPQTIRSLRSITAFFLTADRQCGLAAYLKQSVTSAQLPPPKILQPSLLTVTYSWTLEPVYCVVWLCDFSAC